MSVKRYTIECFPAGIRKEDKDGLWVAYSDYAALAAENERLKNVVEGIFDNRVGRLIAENERLRKAGDAMAAYLDECDYLQPSLAAWLAAKEGRDAK